MTFFPTRDEALAILRSERCEQPVIDHCVAVEALALKIGERCSCDLELVSRGALLHDIGRSITHDIQHAVRSVEILKRLEIDERIVLIAQRHIGAGLTAEDALEFGFPPGQYLPETLEEKIVAHADNLIGNPSSPDARRTVKEAIVDFRGKGLLDAAERIMSMHNELSLQCGIDIDEIP